MFSQEAAGAAKVNIQTCVASKAERKAVCVPRKIYEKDSGSVFIINCVISLSHHSLTGQLTNKKHEWLKTDVALNPKNLVSCAKLVRCGTLNMVLQDFCWLTGQPLMLRWGWGRQADWIITDVREKCHSQLWFVFFTSHGVSGGGTP